MTRQKQTKDTERDKRYIRDTETYKRERHRDRQTTDKETNQKKRKRDRDKLKIEKTEADKR